VYSQAKQIHAYIRSKHMHRYIHRYMHLAVDLFLLVVDLFLSIHAKWTMTDAAGTCTHCPDLMESPAGAATSLQCSCAAGFVPTNGPSPVANPRMDTLLDGLFPTVLSSEVHTGDNGDLGEFGSDSPFPDLSGKRRSRSLLSHGSSGSGSGSGSGNYEYEPPPYAEWPPTRSLSPSSCRACPAATYEPIPVQVQCGQNLLPRYGQDWCVEDWDVEVCTGQNANVCQDREPGEAPLCLSSVWSGFGSGSMSGSAQLACCCDPDGSCTDGDFMWCCPKLQEATWSGNGSGSGSGSGSSRKDDELFDFSDAGSGSGSGHGCTDSLVGDLAWVDSRGDPCEFYVSNTSLCREAFLYASSGYDASHMCCVCGGGCRAIAPASSCGCRAPPPKPEVETDHHASGVLVSPSPYSSNCHTEWLLGAQGVRAITLEIEEFSTALGDTLTISKCEDASCVPSREIAVLQGGRSVAQSQLPAVIHSKYVHLSFVTKQNPNCVAVGKGFKLRYSMEKMGGCVACAEGMTSAKNSSSAAACSDYCPSMEGEIQKCLARLDAPPLITGAWDGDPSDESAFAQGCNFVQDVLACFPERCCEEFAAQDYLQLVLPALGFDESGCQGQDCSLKCGMPWRTDPRWDPRLARSGVPEFNSSYFHIGKAGAACAENRTLEELYTVEKIVCPRTGR